MKITWDFETRSRCDLKTCGMYKYAEDPSTEALLLSVLEDDGEPVLWVPEKFRPLINTRLVNTVTIINDEELREIVKRADSFEAHNAGFERCIWREIMVKRYGFPEIPIKKWRCSAVKAAAFSLPRDLAGACQALGLLQQKDLTGYRVMLKMCKPRKATKHDASEWHEDPADFEVLARYCLQDTRAEHALSCKLPDLTEKEQRVWEVDQIINDRGIAVDLASIDKLIAKVEAKEGKLLLEIQEITNGQIKSVRQQARTLDWLADQDIFLENMQKQTVEDALKLGLSSSKAARLLEIRQSLAKASVSKLAKMRDMACKDGRVRGVFLFNGANTGRWAAKGLQVHNYPRESFKEKETEDFVELETELAEALYGCVIQNASKCLRGMMYGPPGKELAAADYSAIEARALAWLAGETKVVETFRSGRDVYKVAAADIFRVKYDEVTDEQRQIGKVAILALGYQGWLGAFDAMAAGYNVRIKGDPEDIAKAKADAEAFDKLSPHEKQQAREEMTAEEKQRLSDPEGWAREKRTKEIILAWRQSNQAIVQFWAGVEAAALQAVRTGKAYSYGRIKYGMRNGFLHCRLPSGRLLTYPQAFVKTIETKYGQIKDVIGFMGVDDKGHWGPQATYGGSLTENIIQALCRDILAETLVRLEDHGLSPVIHVHDEGVIERPVGTTDLKQFESLVSVVPSWAAGLPLTAKGWVGKRYRKG